MAINVAQHPVGQRIVNAVQWVVKVLLVVGVARCVIVGFSGGRIPFAGTHVQGNAGHGFLWLFIAGSVAFGIYQVISLLVDTVHGGDKRAGDPQPRR
jgi:hypothetical protein